MNLLHVKHFLIALVVAPALSAHATPILGPRTGRTEKAWDNLVSRASSPNPAIAGPALDSIWNARIPPGIQSAWYSMDVFKAFKSQPEFFIKHSLAKFGGNEKCVLFWLIPREGFIEFSEFKSVLEPLAQKKGTALLTKNFYTAGKLYREKLETTDSNAALRSCRVRGGT